MTNEMRGHTPAHCFRCGVAAALLGAWALLPTSGAAWAQAPGGAAPPPNVVVQTVRLRDATDEDSFIGRVQAIDKVTIRARVDGFLASRGFEEGKEVKKDQVLFTLEKEPYEAALAAAKANLANAQAALELAQATYDRTKPLADRGTASQAALDDAISKLSQARGSVQAQEAALKQAELNLGYTEIHAPMDGRTGRATYSVGEYVGPSSNPLVTLVRQDPMYVAFPVPQRVLLTVRREGRTAESVVVGLKLPDGSTYTHDGAIKFAEVEGNAGTDTITVRAEFPNPDRLLVDQQIVGVSVRSKTPELKLMMSQSALLLDQQGAYVLVVTPDNKVDTRRIEAGEQRGPQIVVTTGLAEGDRVITSGHQKVRPGMTVEATEIKDDLSAAQN
ncbi:efflux RND transporter periplasmic adaptor subunit [Hyphomicrobium sp.]|uniref:efflux RND transporter periplasmic adaptor subunit n=1 Tax=Hyphomicrobium sp. TaxID=82 RepID=UPI0025B8FFF7|nr:efflux RND transporter periplasmic adaptor subunit [Hyphomicrobium sp.]MCC7250764.1 efflux RND transporter periplasmic adaptor subunit [Hyphomicrobium sp.]